MIGHSSCLCHAELGELTNTYHHFQSRYVPSDSGYTYCNSLPDKKFFYWFGKSKLTSHPTHTLQMANQLTSHQSQSRHVIMGGMGWWPHLENDPSTSNGIFWCPEIFPSDNTEQYHWVSETQEKWPSKWSNFYSCDKNDKYAFWMCRGGGGRVSVSTLTYFQKQEKVTEINANVTSLCNPLQDALHPQIWPVCVTLWWESLYQQM